MSRLQNSYFFLIITLYVTTTETEEMVHLLPALFFFFQGNIMTVKKGQIAVDKFLHKTECVTEEMAVPVP